MKTLIINDPHLGVRRQGGATPASRKALEEYMFREFKKLLEIPHDNLVILGDLYDKRNVPEHNMLRTVMMLYDRWCIVVLGNHDLGGVAGGPTMSSAEFVAEMAKVQVAKEPTFFLDDDIYIIPHLYSQEEFDVAVQNVPENVNLLTHCNIDSPWSHGDHSLNLSKEQINDLDKKGVKVLAAHEHPARDYMNNVTVIGNQFPSSIADCLGGDKRAVVINDGTVEFVTTWSQADHFSELDWSDITDTGKEFIRITGNCSLAEYSGIVKEVNELRKNSDAFIIANAVSVETTDTTLTKEEVTQFNIIKLLMDQIDGEFLEDIKSCL